MSWNRRHCKARLLLGVALAVCALPVMRPPAALAGYPLAERGRVVLAFGATYTSANATSTSTHRGTDIAAETGTRVLAPLAGTVTFAGRVPAVGGGTVRAVTLSTASGSVTLLPLSDVSVAKGDSLAEGAGVGTLAGDGDGSSSATHLHVGVRRGDLYVDPMSVLTLPLAGPESPSGVQAGAGAARESAAAAPSPAQGQSARASGASAHSNAGARAPAGSHAAAHATAGAPSAVLRLALPGARLAPGVSVGGVAPQLAPSAAAAAADRALTPLRAVGLTPAHMQASADAAGAAMNALVARAREAAGGAARTAGILAAAVLGGIGLLWPLWRRQDGKGSSEDRVSVLGDDVAAAVGR